VGERRFEGAKNANKCFLLDKVHLTETGCVLHERFAHPTLVGILETTGPKYGFTSRQHPIYLCKPIDIRYPPFYVGSKIVDRISNKLITFQFDKWEKEFPQGNFLELLGDCGIIEAEKKANLLNANPYKWMKSLPNIIQPYKLNRTVLEGFTFNIDPDACKDVDDSITFLENGISINIADVSAWVVLNPWMKFAENIGTSLYENGTCVKPMFPSILSEDYFSLVEGKKRVTYSLIIEFGEKISWHFDETLTTVNKSYTYDSVYEDKSFDSIKMKEAIYRLSGIQTDDSHKWIEILMLFYNEKAGEVLQKKNKGILRNQKGVNLERAKLFEPFGEEYMYLCYESAKYCLPTDDTTHSMLNMKHYAHASSPIRRYVDVINQFALKEYEFSYETLERFNIQQKKAKEYERNLLYIELFQNKRVLDGVVLDNKNIFVNYLKKVVKYENSLEVGKKVSLDYYINPQNVKWKDKILFQILDS